MIYIVTEKRDLITDLVIEWIKARGVNFKRFNDDEFIKEHNNYLKLKIKKLWLRRGTFNLIPNKVHQDFSNKKPILNYLIGEVTEYSIYLEYKLKNSLGNNYIGSFTKEALTNNKLINLEIAKNIGFKTPITLVTSSKSELISFYNIHKSIIYKDLKAPVNIRTRHKILVSTGVKLVNQQMLDQLKEYFAPVFVQKYIEKKYELRVFVFSNKLYAMAIFSQIDKKTVVDYRNYNTKQPNKCVPAFLPKSIENKVWKFMEKANMNTGSIDLIVTPGNEYYFLEINPMGQFHWLSANCNYYIEKDIANFLVA